MESLRVRNLNTILIENQALALATMNAREFCRYRKTLAHPIQLQAATGLLPAMAPAGAGKAAALRNSRQKRALKPANIFSPKMTQANNATVTISGKIIAPINGYSVFDKCISPSCAFGRNA